MGLFFLVELLCFLVLVSEWARKSQHWPLLRLRSRLWHRRRGNILCGLEDLFLHRSLHSRVCGSARKNMTSLDLQLYTASVSRRDFAPWNICDMLFPIVALRLLHHVGKKTCF